MRSDFKKALSLLLSIILIVAAVSVIPVSAADNDELPFVPVNSGKTGSCNWSVISGKLTVSGSGSMADYGWTSQYSPKAPWSNSKITSIEIKDGVTHIGDGAFRLNGPTEVSFPQSVTSIGKSAFRDCATLKKAVIPDNVTELGFAAFCGCSALEEIVLSKNIKKIDEALFLGCKSLKGIDIPEGVEEIIGGAFSGCTSLSEITLPDTLTGIGSMAFEDCTSLKKITIPPSVTEIASDAFLNCDELVIYGESGSAAETFAQTNGYKFVKLVERILGDVDGDGKSDIVDATIVQRVATNIKVSIPEEILMNGDVDSDGKLSITDATFIQRHATFVKTPYPIGEKI